ncbi:MAG: hypothetical protein F6K11_13160 [Leptolyngbya sp. SIO3F4]|nr:hypothetical protein [Leptolyngbya sp. SIO3F4]
MSDHSQASIPRNQRKRWLLFAISGLLCTGFGLSLLGEAILVRWEQGPWFWWGTAALVVFNTGLSLFGQAVIIRVRMTSATKATEKR